MKKIDVNCAECSNKDEKIENLQSKLEAKLIFINNGNSEELYVLQEEIIAKENLITTLRYENERQMTAIKHAHSSLTWSNTEYKVPHAVWHLEQVLPQAFKATEQPSEAEAEE